MTPYWVVLSGWTSILILAIATMVGEYRSLAFSRALGAVLFLTAAALVHNLGSGYEPTRAALIILAFARFLI